MVKRSKNNTKKYNVQITPVFFNENVKSGLNPISALSVNGKENPAIGGASVLFKPVTKF
jgi:hypothetical protein